MAKVALDGTINIQGTKEIDRTNLAQLREPKTNDRDDCGRTDCCNQALMIDDYDPRKLVASLHEFLRLCKVRIFQNLFLALKVHIAHPAANFDHP